MFAQRTLVLFVCFSFGAAVCPSACFSCDKSDNCLGPDGRNWSSTSSYERFCKDGFFGKTCTGACPTTCSKPFCSSSGYCMATPNRTAGSDSLSAEPYEPAIFCKDGFFGASCGSKCPAQCAQVYCSSGGYCMATPTRSYKSDALSAGSYDRAIWCKDGYRGSTCSYECSTNCAQLYCSNSGACMATPTRTNSSDADSARSYDLASYCKDGFYGSTCSIACPRQCAQLYCSAGGYCMASSTRVPGGDYLSSQPYDPAIWCKTGYYGSSCSSECSVNCRQSFCSRDGNCMATPTRTAGSDYYSAASYDRAIFCKDGFYGTTCSSSCPKFCTQNYCSASGYCMSTPTRNPANDSLSAQTFDKAIWCKDGYYSSNCASECSETCIQPYCASQGACLAAPDRTPGSDYGSASSFDRAIFCKAGFFGSSCSSKCPKYCSQLYCSSTGNCLATPTRIPSSDAASSQYGDPSIWCQDGHYGVDCSSMCSENCAQLYCASNGYCMATPTRTPESDGISATTYDRARYCKDGFYGLTCSSRCPKYCSQSYCSAGGYCLAWPTRTPGSDSGSASPFDPALWCQVGYYGASCTQFCPSNCVQSFCSASGYCMSSQKRFPGSDYGSATAYDRAIWCKDGFYGSSCSLPCPKTCLEPYCTADGYCMGTRPSLTESE